MTTMYQCDLSRGDARTRAYIEERGARLGASVELKEKGFEGFWRVDAVADTGIDAKALGEKQILDRDSLPSVVGQKRPK